MLEIKDILHFCIQTSHIYHPLSVNVQEREQILYLLTNAWKEVIWGGAKGLINICLFSFYCPLTQPLKSWFPV